MLASQEKSEHSTEKNQNKTQKTSDQNTYTSLLARERVLFYYFIFFGIQTNKQKKF